MGSHCLDAYTSCPFCQSTKLGIYEDEDEDDEFFRQKLTIHCLWKHPIEYVALKRLSEGRSLTFFGLSDDEEEEGIDQQTEEQKRKISQNSSTEDGECKSSQDGPKSPNKPPNYAGNFEPEYAQEKNYDAENAEEYTPLLKCSNDAANLIERTVTDMEEAGDDHHPESGRSSFEGKEENEGKENASTPQYTSPLVLQCTAFNDAISDSDSSAGEIDSDQAENPDVPPTAFTLVHKNAPRKFQESPSNTSNSQGGDNSASPSTPRTPQPGRRIQIRMSSASLENENLQSLKQEKERLSRLLSEEVEENSEERVEEKSESELKKERLAQLKKRVGERLSRKSSEGISTLEKLRHLSNISRSDNEEDEETKETIDETPVKRQRERERRISERESPWSPRESSSSQRSPSRRSRDRDLRRRSRSRRTRSRSRERPIFTNRNRARSAEKEWGPGRNVWKGPEINDTLRCKHNQRLCLHFPNCLGRMCWGTHPPCPILANCHFQDCPFEHKDRMKACLPCGRKIRNITNYSWIVRCPHRKQEMCRYGVHCRKDAINCNYRHEKCEIKHCPGASTCGFHRKDHSKFGYLCPSCHKSVREWRFRNKI